MPDFTDIRRGASKALGDASDYMSPIEVGMPWPGQWGRGNLASSIWGALPGWGAQQGGTQLEQPLQRWQGDAGGPQRGVWERAFGGQ